MCMWKTIKLKAQERRVRGAVKIFEEVMAEIFPISLKNFYFKFKKLIEFQLR